MNYFLDNLKIGERIRSLRESMSLSRERFAEMIDISEVFLGQIERGESSLSLKTLSNIVAFTGSSSDFILFGDESKNTNLKKIEKIMQLSSEDTQNFVYNIIQNVSIYNKKISKNK